MTPCFCGIVPPVGYCFCCARARSPVRTLGTRHKFKFFCTLTNLMLVHCWCRQSLLPYRHSKGLAGAGPIILSCLQSCPCICPASLTTPEYSDSTISVYGFLVSCWCVAEQSGPALLYFKQICWFLEPCGWLLHCRLILGVVGQLAQVHQSGVLVQWSHNNSKKVD